MRCRHCGGNVYYDPIDRQCVCLQCSRPDVPPIVMRFDLSPQAPRWLGPKIRRAGAASVYLRLELRCATFEEFAQWFALARKDLQRGEDAGDLWCQEAGSDWCQEMQATGLCIKGSTGMVRSVGAL